MNNLKQNNQIEKAIKFLVHGVEDSGNNSKPVILHSIRVAFLLERYGYHDLVIAGLLHDLLEDTTVKPEIIRKEFGDKVLELVQICTFDNTIADKIERYKDSFARAGKYGVEALLIRTADIYDNMDYYEFAPDRKTKDFLIDKVGYFIKISYPLLNKEIFWAEFVKKI